MKRRGASFLSGSIVYPLSEIELAGNGAKAGDAQGSVAAYGQFRANWAGADRGDPLLMRWR